MNFNRVLLLLALVLVCFSAWQLHLSKQRELALHQTVVDLQSEVAQLKSQLSAVEAQVSELNKTSVQSMVNEANNAILQGWESLVNTVEDELKKAREAMEQNSGAAPGSAQPKGGAQPNSQSAPQLESPDGTDRT